MVTKFVEILADKKALIDRTQEIVISKINNAIKTKDICTIALAGGSTPKPLYESLAGYNLPWGKIHIFWGDERYVPANHPDSNQLMTRQTWLDKVAIPEANIHPMATDGASPEADAAQHERELKTFFQVGTGEFPTFDLILLGMGDDGHTASLFPHTDVLTEVSKAISVGNKSGQPRLTFTVPLINQADCVLFLVAGANKTEVLDRVFATQGDNMLYPSRLIQPQGELWWLVDETAGTLIKDRSVSLAS